MHWMASCSPRRWTSPPRRRDPPRRRHGGSAKDANTRALEKRLTDSLGLEVNVDHRGEGGTLKIKYRNLEQLDAVLKKLSR